jgi:5'-phosphate synthase pdxT subunit
VPAAGPEAVAVRRPAELASVDALIIPGGESTVIARLLRIFDLMQPLRERIAAGMPVLGTCAGMILLADTIADPACDAAGVPQESVGGLDVVVERNAFGRQVDSFETTLAVTGMGETPVPVDAVFIRAPRVVSAGADVKILASVGEFPVAVRQGNLMATSFHPESAGVDAFHRWLVERAGTDEGVLTHASA